MRAIRNHGGEPTDRRWRRAASWLAGIAMPAIVAVQAVAHESQRTTTATRAEPTLHVEPAVEAFVPVTESAEAMTECDVADSPSALAEVKAATEAEPNDAAATSEGHQAETDVLILQVEASHYRDLDQTSLVFRADVVGMWSLGAGYIGPGVRRPRVRNLRARRRRSPRIRHRRCRHARKLMRSGRPGATRRWAARACNDTRGEAASGRDSAGRWSIHGSILVERDGIAIVVPKLPSPR